jgi:hypothetical protein
MAMTETQETHPLELKEVKYIWGDFITPDIAYLHPSQPLLFYNSPPSLLLYLQYPLTSPRSRENGR